MVAVISVGPTYFEGAVAVVGGPSPGGGVNVKETVASLVKSKPLIVMVSPPESGPMIGKSDVTTGAAV
jgi:hypothetical protein